MYKFFNQIKSGLDVIRYIIKSFINYDKESFLQHAFCSLMNFKVRVCICYIVILWLTIVNLYSLNQTQVKLTLS